MGKHDVIRKTGSIYTDNSLERREMRTDSATAKGNRPMHRKFGDVRMCGFRDMHAEWPVVRQTDTQTDRHEIPSASPRGYPTRGGILRDIRLSPTIGHVGLPAVMLAVSSTVQYARVAYIQCV